MRHTMPALALLGLLFGVLSAGCQHIESERQTREKILEDRATIQAYHDAVPATYPKQEAWVAAVGEMSLLSPPKEIQASVRTGVIPTLEAYVAALDVMPRGISELRRLHASWVLAHVQLLDAYRAFADGLDDKSFVEHRKKLGGTMSVFHARQIAYRTAMASLYEKHGIELNPAPPIRLAQTKAPSP